MMSFSASSWTPAKTSSPCVRLMTDLPRSRQDTYRSVYFGESGTTGRRQYASRKRVCPALLLRLHLFSHHFRPRRLARREDLLVELVRHLGVDRRRGGAIDDLGDLRSVV